MSQAIHPAPEELHSYVLGRQDRAHADVERHLLHCDDCCALIQPLPEDPLLGLLRSASPSRPSNERQGDTVGREDRHVSTLVAAPTPEGAQAVVAAFADHPRYRILESLGGGGMGAVYKAEHRRMERLVVLKFIHPHLLQNTNAIQRFHREAKAAAKLNHPHIVTAYDADHIEQMHFLVMEYVEGVPLSQHLETRGPLPVQEACEFVRQAALGLQHAHNKGMVHRDVKPGNLMLTPKGEVKILDFGLARLSADTATSGSLTREGAILGTPDFMAPEQISNSATADSRADIYSLGCMLYCLLTGHAPFPDGADMQKILAHLERRPTPVDEIRRDVPPALARVIDSMLDKEPAGRPATAFAVAQALAPYCDAATASTPVPSTTAANPFPGPFAGGLRSKGLFILVLVLPLLALVASVVVLRIKTPHGTLVIETENPDIEVHVKQGGKVVAVIDEKTGHSATLKVGEYDLELLAGKGMSLAADRLTLTSEGKIVKVRRESSAPAKGPEGAKEPKAEPVRKKFRVSAVTHVGGVTLKPSANTGLWIEKGQQLHFRVSGAWGVLARVSGGYDLLTIAIGKDNQRALWSRGGAPEVRIEAPATGWLFLGNTDPFIRDNWGHVEVELTVN